MPSVREQLEIIDEDYLVGIANRGLVNRASKELPDTEITVSFSETGMSASFADGTDVTITEKLLQFECSCPSRTICKHVIMAMMKGSALLRESTTGEQREQREPVSRSGAFDAVLALDAVALIKEYGQKAYNDALSKVLAGAEADIEDGSILTVQLQDSPFIVRFLPGADPRESICSCKTKTCRHRPEAILQYIRFKTGRLDFEPVKQENVTDISVVPHIQHFADEIFTIGLIRLPVEYAEKCGQLATVCHGAGFATLERLLQTAERELLLYHQKNVAFQQNRLLSHLTQILQACHVLVGPDDSLAAETAGAFRQQYVELPKISLWGLGAYSWYAKSGFCGITALFYCPALKKVLTFGSTRPVKDEREAIAGIEQMLHAKSSWNLPISLDGLSKSNVSLTQAKVSDNDRLSSSEETAGAMMALTGLDSSEIQPVVFDDFSLLAGLFSMDPDDSRAHTVVIKASALGEDNFDRVTQTYTMSVVDRHGNALTLKIDYSKINETAILNFEWLIMNQKIPDALTVSVMVSIEHMEAVVFPIAVWMDGEIKNIGTAPLYIEAKKGKYAKFFAGEDIGKTLPAAAQSAGAMAGSVGEDIGEVLPETVKKAASERPMAVLFAHIEQVQYALSQIFDNGFLTVRGTEKDLHAYQRSADALGFSQGAALLDGLISRMAAFKAGTLDITELAIYFANVWSYYEIVLKMLVVQTISIQKKSIEKEQ